jgi:uncharacterized protein (DUF1778 family)
MTKAAPKFTVRPETKAQADRHRKAAKSIRRSLNFFYLEAADRLANTVLTSEKPVEQLMVNRDQPSLNQ